MSFCLLLLFPLCFLSMCLCLCRCMLLYRRGHYTLPSEKKDVFEAVAWQLSLSRRPRLEFYCERCGVKEADLWGNKHDIWQEMFISLQSRVFCVGVYKWDRWEKVRRSLLTVCFSVSMKGRGIVCDCVRVCVRVCLCMWLCAKMRGRGGKRDYDHAVSYHSWVSWCFLS